MDEPEILSEEERRAARLRIVELFGKIDFDPDYDYKEQRRRDMLKMEKLYAEWDQELSAEELEARFNGVSDPAP